MKLLFDQNLSVRLIELLVELYPDADHVSLPGMSTDDDEAIWHYAGQHDLGIVGNDADFFYRSLRFGPPPKGIWVCLGNCTTGAIARLLRIHVVDIQAFIAATETAFLPLG